MADEREALLREMAKHRGFKLVKSRRRKPGGDFGRYGLTDAATGQDCFGIGKNGLEASADDIEEYLRGAAKADWKRSLGAAGKRVGAAKARKQAAPPPSPKPEREPEPEPEPEPKPELLIRESKAKDAEAIAALIRAPPAAVKAALRRLVAVGEAPMVAEDNRIVGCAAFHVLPSLRHGAIGRLGLLVVEPDSRRRGIGTALLETVEARLRERGCKVIEAVSDIDLANAHGFFRRAGYERTGYRFAKPVKG